MEQKVRKMVEVWVVGTDGRILIMRRCPEGSARTTWETVSVECKEEERRVHSAVVTLSEKLGLRVSPEKLIYLGRETKKECVTEVFCVRQNFHLGDLKYARDEVEDVKQVYENELQLMGQCNMFNSEVLNRFYKYEERILYFLRYQIEEAIPEDAAELYQVRQEAFEEEIKRCGHNPLEEYSEEKEREFIKNNIVGNCSYVLRDKETRQILGGIDGKLLANHAFYVRSVFLRKKYQNRQLGSILLAFLTKEFQEIRYWQVKIPAGSERNEHFYTKNGFRSAGGSAPEEDGFYLSYFEKGVRPGAKRAESKPIEPKPMELKPQQKEKEVVVGVPKETTRTMGIKEEPKIIRSAEKVKQKSEEVNENLHIYEFSQGKWNEVTGEEMEETKDGILQSKNNRRKLSEVLKERNQV